MSNSSKVLLGLVVVVVLAIGIAFYVSRQPAPSGETVKIGAALCLTGTCADWGEGELKAYQMVVDETNKTGGINGKPIQLIVEDTGYDPKGITTVVQKLVEIDQVDALLGPTWGDSFQGGYSIINSKHIVSVSPSSAFESLFYNKQPVDYAFSTWFPERADIDAVQAYAQQHHLTRVVVLHDEDTFGAMMANLFDKQAPSRGLTVIHEEKFPIGYDDFRTTIAKIKSLKPDAVFVSFQGPVTKAKYLRQVHELGLTAQVLSSTDIEDPSLLKDFGSVMEGVVYGYPNVTGAYDEFAQKYKARYGSDPQGPSAANAYDAAHILIAALTESTKTGASVRDLLETISVSGAAIATVKFDTNHQLFGAAFIQKTIKNGQFVVVQ